MNPLSVVAISGINGAQITIYISITICGRLTIERLRAATTIQTKRLIVCFHEFRLMLLHDYRGAKHVP